MRVIINAPRKILATPCTYTLKGSNYTANKKTWRPNCTAAGREHTFLGVSFYFFPIFLLRVSTENASELTE